MSLNYIYILCQLFILIKMGGCCVGYLNKNKMTPLIIIANPYKNMIEKTVKIQKNNESGNIREIINLEISKNIKQNENCKFLNEQNLVEEINDDQKQMEEILSQSSLKKMIRPMRKDGKKKISSLFSEISDENIQNQGTTNMTTTFLYGKLDETIK